DRFIQDRTGVCVPLRETALTCSPRQEGEKEEERSAGLGRQFIMAVESFPELLQKLRDVHDHELEGWQEKVLELTNKKNIDTKRLEELHNRNQLLREQQRILTENIKQLENRLRAGLCDRCTVTQEMAKKRQHDYEASQIQSLQHISLLVSEMNALKKENDKLREELKTLREPQNHQNGHSEEGVSPEVKLSPEPAVTPGLKISQSPAGGATVKQESDGNLTPTLEKASEHQRVQSWQRTFSFESDKLVITNSSPVRWGTEQPERRAASLDSMEHGHSPLSPSLPSPLLKNNSVFSSTASEERTSRQQIHTPVPLRPLPIKTGHLSLPWSLSESSDWVSVTATGSGGLTVRSQQSPSNNSNVLRFPKLIPLSSAFQSHLNGPASGAVRAMSRRSQLELVESREKRRRPSGNSQHHTQKGSLEKISERRKRKHRLTCLTQDDQKAKRMRKHTHRVMLLLHLPHHMLRYLLHLCAHQALKAICKEQDEVKEDEKSLPAESSLASEYKKVPSLTISLQPVVVMESLKTEGQISEPGSRSVEQEEKENNNKETSRKRFSQALEAPSQRSIKERRIRLSRGPQGNHTDPEQE
ncbi:hypothetical protein DNTS_017540, partial [Danionella cerebrum]